MRFVIIIISATLYFFMRSVIFRGILKVKATPLYLIDISLLTSVSFVSIGVLFILIIAKIMKQNTVGPQAAVQNGGTRRKHVVAVKTFGAVSICFIISYSTVYVMGSRLLPTVVLYLYFLNHICNPVIYLLFNREFRANVRALI